MSDTYDLLCKVAMGLPMSAEDLAELGQRGLIVTEVKTILTPEGRATLKAIEAERVPALPAVRESLIDSLLREFVGIESHPITISRDDLDGLDGYRRAHLVEVGVVATMHEWGDSPAERKPTGGMVARLSRRAKAFLDDRDKRRQREWRVEHPDAA